MLLAQSNARVAAGGNPAAGLGDGAVGAAAHSRTWPEPHAPDTHGQDARGWSDTVRRRLNVAAAIVVLVLAAPLMLVVAIAIRLTSPGPVLYAQPRVGLDRRSRNGATQNARRVIDYGGKVFRIYKFRTMYAVTNDQADREEAQRWATQDDPRVTPIGRFLRRYRLDELPQLINVLRGDMNLVGPRPEQPMIFAELRDQIPDYWRRQRVLPGITGWAQINQPYDSCMDDVRRKVMYDLEYINRRSALEDLKILLYTLPAVLVKRGGW